MRQAHLISFYSIKEPTLAYWENGEEVHDGMEGFWCIEDSGEKACIGYRDEEGRKPCRMRMRGSAQCGYCATRDIARVHTRMDFAGFEHLQDEIVNRPYSVYLVSFGEKVKCGVTRTERVEKRVREQGADCWAEVMRFSNSEDAYEMEGFLQREMGFKNAVHAATKLKQLGRDDPKLLEDAIEEMQGREVFRMYLREGVKVVREDYKLPKAWELSTCVEGKILTAKGPLLFYENGGGAKVVNMKKLTGNLVEFP